MAIDGKSIRAEKVVPWEIREGQLIERMYDVSRITLGVSSSTKR